MKRRDFAKTVVMGVCALAGLAMAAEKSNEPGGDFYEEPVKRLPIRRFNVVVAGGGTAGVVAALAAAWLRGKRQALQSRRAPPQLAARASFRMLTCVRLSKRGCAIRNGRRQRLTRVSCWFGRWSSAGT